MAPRSLNLQPLTENHGKKRSGLSPEDQKRQRLLETGLGQLVEAENKLNRIAIEADALSQGAPIPGMPSSANLSQNTEYNHAMKKYQSASRTLFSLLRDATHDINLEIGFVEGFAPRYKGLLLVELLNDAKIMSDTDAIALFQKASHPRSGLGQIFHHQCGLFEPKETRGRLKDIKTATTHRERKVKAEKMLENLLKLSTINKNQKANFAAYKTEICDALFRKAQTIDLAQRAKFLQCALSEGSPLQQVMYHQRGWLPLTDLMSQKGRIKREIQSVKQSVLLCGRMNSTSSLWSRRNQRKSSTANETPQNQTPTTMGRRFT